MGDFFGRFIVACNEGKKGIGNGAPKVGLLWAGMACVLCVQNEDGKDESSIVDLWEHTRDVEEFGNSFFPEPPGGGLWVGEVQEPLEWDGDGEPDEKFKVKWRRLEIGEVEDLAKGKAPWGVMV